MQLVDDWKKCYKWLSVQIPALGAATLASYAALPDDWKSAIPHWAIAVTAITFLVGGAVGRVIEQPTKAPNE
jgi:hypothetical protein